MRTIIIIFLFFISEFAFSQWIKSEDDYKDFQILEATGSGNLIYTATTKGIFFSDNGGAKFELFSEKHTGTIYSINYTDSTLYFITKTKDSTFFYSYRKNIFKKNYISQISYSDHIGNCIVINDTILLNCENGLIESFNNGELWQSFIPNIKISYNRSILKLFNDTIYYLTRNNCLYTINFRTSQLKLKEDLLSINNWNKLNKDEEIFDFNISSNNIFILSKYLVQIDSDSKLKNIELNNAFYFTKSASWQNYLIIGSIEDGVFIYNTENHKMLNVKEGLPQFKDGDHVSYYPSLVYNIDGNIICCTNKGFYFLKNKDNILNFK